MLFLILSETPSWVLPEGPYNNSFTVIKRMMRTTTNASRSSVSTIPIQEAIHKTRKKLTMNERREFSFPNSFSMNIFSSQRNLRHLDGTSPFLHRRLQIEI